MPASITASPSALAQTEGRMGSMERRRRHRAELRAAILDAALEIIAENGLRGLSIRAIADRIEYSAATVYLYFDSKEALVQEVAREGFRRLLESLRAANDANASDDREPLEQGELAASTSLPPGSAPATPMATLATAHGLVLLYLSGTITELAGSPEELKRLVERCLLRLDGCPGNGTSPASAGAAGTHA